MHTDCHSASASHSRGIICSTGRPAITDTFRLLVDSIHTMAMVRNSQVCLTGAGVTLSSADKPRVSGNDIVRLFASDFLYRAESRRNSFFAGTIFTVCIVQLPQRFVTVNSESAFQAGVKLLPFGVFVPAGSSLAATLMGRARIRPEFILFAGGVFEIVGTICLSKTSVGLQIPRAQYGFQVLTGTGVGFFNAALILLVPYVLEKRDLGKKFFDATTSVAESSQRLERQR